MVENPGEYDRYRRYGVFDKCNGLPVSETWDRSEIENDLPTAAYFDGYDSCEQKIFHEKNGLADIVMEIEFEPETVIHFVYSEAFGEIEGMFDSDGKLLGIWCNNDACWRQEYFGPFLEALNIRVETHYSDDGDWETKLKEAAKEYWGLSDFDE